MDHLEGIKFGRGQVLELHKLSIRRFKLQPKNTRFDRPQNERYKPHRPKRGERCLIYEKLYKGQSKLPKSHGVPKAQRKRNMLSDAVLSGFGQNTRAVRFQIPASDNAVRQF